jgi:hypothetical protein
MILEMIAILGRCLSILGFAYAENALSDMKGIKMLYQMEI